TAAAATASGLSVTLRPREGSGGAALAAAFPDGPGTVVIPGAAEPAPDLAELLGRRGWAVVPVKVYRTVRAASVEDVVAAAWPDGFDAYVATAPSNLAAARDLLGAPTPPLIALGSTTAAAAERDGLPVAAVAADASASGLAAALATLRKEAS
ncbi:uroporphyrinogen-III synthase, partial [Micropruina sonneratiae]|uniref:uroporphyrinogen-III synthase n=1 Tax=Micropruina sonneratiae TaxID=2986940 RepID=UPI002226CF5E